MAPPEETLQAESYTKKALLEDLRVLEKQLYSRPVVGKVKKLSLADRQSFVGGRLQLTAVIAKLNASVMRDIRQELEKKSDDIRQGITALDKSLRKLEGAKGWAKGVNGLIGILGQVVSLI